MLTDEYPIVLLCSCLQMNTFTVFAIIGALFAGVQVIIASTGANDVFSYYDYTSSDVSQTNAFIAVSFTS